MKNRIYLGALLFGILLFGLWTQLEPPLSDGEAKARLERVVADSFLNSRFDQVSVDLNDGILVINLEDTAICSIKDAVFRIQKHLNLRDFETVRKRGFRSVRFNDDNPQAQILVSVLFESDAMTMISEISQRKEQIIAATREEFGWGPEAGNKAYEIFIQSTPELQNLSYEVYGHCASGNGISLVKSDFTLKIMSEDAREYIRLINRVIESYQD